MSCRGALPRTTRRLARGHGCRPGRWERPQHLPHRGRPPRRRRRPSARPAAGDGRSPAHRTGAQQPARQRGGADYIVRPFSATEPVTRVQAALRRHGQPETFALGELRIDYAARRVTLADRYVPLAGTEFDLLRIISRNAGRVVTHRTLLRRVWGRRGSHDTARIRTVMKKLRRKLGDPAANPTYIFNRHGVGYSFGDPAAA